MIVDQAASGSKRKEQAASTQCLNKKSVAAQFSNAANNYDRHANVQKEIAQVNIELLLKTAKQVVANSVDLGCGTGTHTKRIAALSTHCVAIDISHEMLKTAKANTTNSITTNANNIHFCRGDADDLPLLANSVDVFHSSMALQWSSSPLVCLSEISRVLTKNGTAQLAIMLDSSMHELRDAWQNIGVISRVNRFFSRKQWLDAIQLISSDSNNNVDFEYQEQCFQEWHSGSLQMLRALKNVGAATKQGEGVIDSVQSTLLSKKNATNSSISKQELLRVDEQMTKQGSAYPLSYDILFLAINKTKT